MTLDTQRMTLRKFSCEDVHDIYVLDQDTEVRRYIDDQRPALPWPEFEPKVLKWIESLSEYGPDFGFWTARLPDETFLGWFHLRPNKHLYPGEMEIGYRFQRKFWGQGLATEGTQKLLKYAFSQRGVAYVMATTLAANLGSRRVMEKSGMQLEQSFIYPEKVAPYWSEIERRGVKYSITRKTRSDTFDNQ